MSKNYEIAKELAKLASLMAEGVEDTIGLDDSSGVSSTSKPGLAIHNHNFNTGRLGQQSGMGALLPPEDWQPISLAEAEERARSIYGQQSHNSDFYPKGLDAMNELLQGHSPVVANKKTLQKFASKYGTEIQLVLDIAQELAKRASLSQPGVEDRIGQARNQGEHIQDRIDSNKSLSTVKDLFKGLPIAEVTKYMGSAANFEPSMDTGGFEGAMEVQASVPVTKKKAAKLASQKKTQR